MLARHPMLRASAAAAALLAFAVAWFGVLPSPHVIGQWIGHRVVEPERYPCEGHACGCASADECWHECCCYTSHQRLVWAIRNGVTPPESVRITEAEWIEAANDVQPGSATCWMCVDELLDDLSHGIARGADQARDCLPPTAEISPAGCKQLISLIVLSLPPARWTGTMAWDVEEAEVPSHRDAALDQSPRWRSLETPTPPPRTALVAAITV